MDDINRRFLESFRSFRQTKFNKRLFAAPPRRALCNAFLLSLTYPPPPCMPEYPSSSKLSFRMVRNIPWAWEYKADEWDRGKRMMSQGDGDTERTTSVTTRRAIIQTQRNNKLTSTWFPGFCSRRGLLEYTIRFVEADPWLFGFGWKRGEVGTTKFSNNFSNSLDAQNNKDGVRWGKIFSKAM